ncbi:MAG: peptide chain release factor N(5)-glutamine methyltransferase [Deltaproteobacteria bacterium]|nr:peptide chain release factor N(5)-glutamine methyltransferase [Deltaproteobacteria bacterium]
MSQDWTILSLLQWTTSFFEKKEIPNPRLDAELLLASVLGLKRIDLYTGHDKKIPEEKLAPFKELIQRRAQREPLQYILGETEFWGLKIQVDRSVLIPRPETELLVEEALKTSSVNILDIGTGSGCISIALAKNLPQAKITATDISPEALTLARRNAKNNGVEAQIEFIKADLFPEPSLYDLIVSNPPYIADSEWPTLQAEVRDYEPRGALIAGPTGIEVYQRIFKEASRYLKKPGTLLLEIGEGQRGPLEKEIRTFSPPSFIKDYNGIDRILIVCL